MAQKSKKDKKNKKNKEITTPQDATPETHATAKPQKLSNKEFKRNWSDCRVNWSSCNTG